jgi:hypothetical protein
MDRTFREWLFDQVDCEGSTGDLARFFSQIKTPINCFYSFLLAKSKNPQMKKDILIARYEYFLSKPGISYREWLYKQKDKDTWVGDIAHDTFRDKETPDGDIHLYLIGKISSNPWILEALNRSFELWGKYK